MILRLLAAKDQQVAEREHRRQGRGDVGEAALTVDNKRLTLRTLQTMAEENVDFLDPLLTQTARDEAIASFDRKDFRELSRKLEVAWLEPGSE